MRNFLSIFGYIMRSKGEYTVDYGGLSIAEHNLNYDITDELFLQFTESEVKAGDCKVEIILKKHSSFLEMRINIKGEVVVECDRCLDDLPLPIDFQSVLIVKFSMDIEDPRFEINAEQEDIIWVNTNDGEIDLTQYFFDSICLSLPISRIHSDDEDGNSTCDGDMLGRFSISSDDNEDASEQE